MHVSLLLVSCVGHHLFLHSDMLLEYHTPLVTFPQHAQNVLTVPRKGDVSVMLLLSLLHGYGYLAVSFC